MKKLRKIRWWTRLYRKLFGWNSISLPFSKSVGITISTNSVHTIPMDLPTETLFHLIFTDEEPCMLELIDYTINNHMEKVARDVVQ